MKTLNYFSKKAKGFMKAYERATARELRDCYTRNSTEKQVAYNWCRSEMNKDGGYDFRIISYNTFQFTCAWLLPTTMGTGLRIETRDYSYLIKDYLPF